MVRAIRFEVHRLENGFHIKKQVPCGNGEAQSALHLRFRLYKAEYCGGFVR